MIEINTVFNAYIDANIVLVLAACLWATLSFVIGKTMLRKAFSLRLRVAYGVLLSVLLAPVVVGLFEYARQIGVVSAGYVISVSDFAVAQYLDGKLVMAPSRFESLLSLRDTFVADVLSLNSTLGKSVAFVLAVGFGIAIWRSLRSVLHIKRIVQGSFAWRQCGRVQLRLTDATHVPFSTRGLRYHYIIIPSELLSQSHDLRIAVAHELQHIRQGDLAWEIAMEAVRPFFFWNPAFAFWKSEVERLRELACDQQVLVSRNYDVKAYCECLLRVCRNTIRDDRSAQIAVPSVTFGQLDASRRGLRSARFLRYRVSSMLDGAARFRDGAWGLVLVAPLAFSVAYGAIAIQRSSDWSQDRLMLSAIVNLERLNQRNEMSVRPDN